jgi:hypothetical protein
MLRYLASIAEYLSAYVAAKPSPLSGFAAFDPSPPEGWFDPSMPLTTPDTISGQQYQEVVQSLRYDGHRLLLQAFPQLSERRAKNIVRWWLKKIEEYTRAAA